MNPPNEDDANNDTATNDNANRANATSNNEAAVPGATVEAPPSGSATATIMAETPLAASSLPLGHTSERNDTNVTANEEVAPATNNEAAATGSTFTLEPPATTTTNNAGEPQTGAFLIESVRKAAATLKEEKEKASDARERHDKSRPRSKSAALHHFLRSREKQRCKDATEEQKRGEDLQHANIDLTKCGDEASPSKPKPVDHGEESSPPTAMAGVMLDTNSITTEVGQELNEEYAALPLAATAGSGLEIIEDEDNPSIPPSMSAIPFDGDSTELVRMSEIIQDDTGPEPTLAMMEFPESKEIADMATGIELIEDDDGPPQSADMLAKALEPDEVSKKPVATTNVPSSNVGPQTRDGPEIIPDSTGPPNDWDDEGMKKTNNEGKKSESAAAEQESIAVDPEDIAVDPEEEVLDDDNNRNEDEELPPIGRGDTEDSHMGMANSNQRDEEVAGVTSEDSIHSADPTLLDASVNPASHGGPHEAVAYRVDARLTMATPLDPALPWWKLKEVRRAFILVSALLLAAAIALGVAFSSDNASSSNSEATSTVTLVDTSSNAPSSSLAPSNVPSASRFPSLKPTGVPSVSAKPTSLLSDEPSSVLSSPPSACVKKISAKMQNIDLPHDDPRDPKIAVDGNDMVVVVRDGPRREENQAYVEFYLLNNGGWLRVDTFLIDDLRNQDYYEVALSGKTAFVGFEIANDGVGAVLVFEQNQFGRWKKVEDPFVHLTAPSHYLFGWSVGIDGDLAFVSDYYNVYMFQRVSNNVWVEFDKVDSGGGSAHSISGHIITVENLIKSHIQLYKYTAEMNEVVPLQDPISVGEAWSTHLSNNYLAYWDGYEGGAFVYRREERNQTFAFHQRLNISRPQENQLALDTDILVVGGAGRTHIFSEQNGNWEETIILDRHYVWYALSGRHLLVATSKEVHFFDIQDCAQEMPTQTPSSSQTPTTSHPSLEPFSSLLPSMSPSSSISPTETPCNLDTKQRADQILKLLSNYSDPDLFQDPTTPQAKALDWITNKDTIKPILCPNQIDVRCSRGGDMNPLVQRYLLATFYFATEGDNWKQCTSPENFPGGGFEDPASVTKANNACDLSVTMFNFGINRVGAVSTDAWLGPTNECEWGGIACWDNATPDLNLCVDQLEFYNNGLSGTLIPEVSILDSLRTIFLVQGSISGPIPPEYGDLNRLIILVLEDNSISRSIPEEMYNLNSLQQLVLDGNQITGSISPSIGNLQSLTHLVLFDNILSNDIPSEMGLLKNLGWLYLHGNDFSGEMPEEVCALRYNTIPPGVLKDLSTDCYSTHPKVVCSCCTRCG